MDVLRAPEGMGFKPSRSASWRTWAFFLIDPGWTRTIVIWV